jgi:hypothetical protein
MKYSIKDLIKIASSAVSQPTPNVDSDTDVERFILALKIKSGQHIVKNNALYKAYKSWSVKPLDKHSFLIYFAQYFPQQRTTTYRYHLLNYRAIELLNKVDNMKVKIK